MKPYSLQFAPMPKGNMGGWQERHFTAVRVPKGPEVPIVTLINGWAEYANVHRARFESGIGEDYVLGPQWAAIGAALRALLNGELGRLDGGTLDGFLNATLTAEGFDPEQL